MPGSPCSHAPPRPSPTSQPLRARAFAVLSRACFTREVTPRTLRRALAERPRVVRRHLVAGMVDDAEAGACSVLERAYLHLVERAHGLPRGHRQLRSLSTGGRAYLDVLYAEWSVIVELDGRAFHDSPGARDADARRDLAERAARDAVTVRLTYGLVVHEGCATAARIGTILRRRGWDGIVSCRSRCAD